MTHHVVSLPEPDGAYLLRCSCGWITQTPDHPTSIHTAKTHKETN